MYLRVQLPIVTAQAKKRENAYTDNAVKSLFTITVLL